MPNVNKKSLAQATISGVGWNFGGRLCERAAQLVTAIILARLLDPEVFGLVAMVLVILTFGTIIAEGGFGQSLIQKKTATPNDEVTAFVCNLATGLVLWVIAIFAAPTIASVLGFAELSQLIPVLAISLPLGALANVPLRLLARRMEFRKSVLISLASTLASALIGIVMALNGYGVWSLVAQNLSQKAANVGLLWFSRTWWPTGRFDWAAWREMRSFGVHIFSVAMLEAISDCLASLLIGKFHSPEQLAFYAKASRFQSLPSQTLSQAANRVLFPAFSRIQTDLVRCRAAFKRTLQLLAFVSLPSMALLFGSSENLILVLLTEKWMPMHPYFQLLCIVGAIYPFQSVNLSMLKAQGHSGTFLRLGVIKRSLSIAVILATFSWGVAAMIWGQIAVAVVGFALNTYSTKKTLDYGALDQIRDVAPYASWSIVAAGAMIAFSRVSLWPPALELITSLVIGAGIYLLGCAVSRCTGMSEALAIWTRRGKVRQVVS
jgi:O-antigen/teichoic acid export membrane protein